MDRKASREARHQTQPAAREPEPMGHGSLGPDRVMDHTRDSATEEGEGEADGESLPTQEPLDSRVHIRHRWGGGRIASITSL